MSSKSVSKSKPEHVPATEAHDDDLIVTPKGKSRMQFLMILGLMVFTLIVFVIPGSFQSALRSGSSVGETILSFRGPDGGTVERDRASFIDVKRRLDDVFRVQRRRVDVSDDDVAVFIVLDDLARDAGIGVSNQEVADAILSGFARYPGSIWVVPPFQSKDRYDQILGALGIRPARFEETVRQILRVERYKAFISAAACWPEPDEIEAAWKEEHQEYAYEYAQIPAADFEDEAAAAVPDDDELRTWYEELPDRQTRFQEEFRQEELAATIVGIRADGDHDGAGLLERYPRPEDEDLDALARTYYDEVAHRRFVRPEPLEDEPDARKRLYFPFEDVEEEAKREAPLQRAMTEWLQDLTQRAADGEELDLAAEADELGLFHVADGVAREHSEWVELEGVGGPFVASALRSAGPNGLTTDVCADEGGLFIGRVTERVEPGLPAFDEIRDRVVEEWVAEQSGELALAAAEELREELVAVGEVVPEDDGDDAGDDDPMEPAGSAAGPDGERIVVDADAFRATVEEAGWTVGTRDWLSGYTYEPMEFQGQQFMLPRSPLDKDPNRDEPANAYIAGRQELEDLDAGELSEAGLGDDGEYAYVVRSLGSRDPTEVRMSRETWDEARAAALIEKTAEFEERYFSRERFETAHGLVLVEDENEGSLDAEGDEDATESEG